VHSTSNKTASQRLKLTPEKLVLLKIQFLWYCANRLLASLTDQ